MLTACCDPPALSLAFTDMVYEPAGVVAGVELLPPPQPSTDRDMEASNNPQLSKRNWRFQRPIILGAKAKPITPARASPPAGIHGGCDGPECRLGLSADIAAAVVTVNVLVAWDPPDGVALAGENEQAAWAGSAPQENFTVPA
jgi:hypothetical protein